MLKNISTEKKKKFKFKCSRSHRTQRPDDSQTSGSQADPGQRVPAGIDRRGRGRERRQRRQL